MSRSFIQEQARRFSRAAAMLIFASMVLAATVLAASSDYFVFVGTYTQTPSGQTPGKGIYTFRFQPATGKLTPVSLAAETASPSFLAVHPNQKFLYAANEHEKDEAPGQENTVSAYAIEPKTGKLTFLNKVSCKGKGPAHVLTDKMGKFLLVLNYQSGSLALLPIHPDGRLGEATAFDQHHGSGPNKQRQAGPHAHGGVFSPDNRFALVAEHGIDEVMVYRFDAATGALTANEPPFLKANPGAAPRHLAFHPNGKIVYSLNELESSVTVMNYKTDNGTLSRVQDVTTLPAAFSGSNTTAEIQVDGRGKFLYASNRGHDSIAVFAIDPVKGTLTSLEHVPTQGKTPRNFSLDPSGSFLLAANQNSDNIVLFRVTAGGRLSPLGKVIDQIPQPVCIVFVKAR